MSNLLIPGDWAIGGVVVAAMIFVETSLVLVLAIGLAGLLRGRSPIVRSMILRAALVAIAVGPAASFALGWFGIPGLRVIPPIRMQSTGTHLDDFSPTPLSIDRDQVRLAERPATGQSEAGALVRTDATGTPVAHAQPAAGPQARAPAPSSSQPRRSRAGWISLAFLGLWIVVSGLLIARLAIANVLIVILRRAAGPAAPGVRERCGSIARQLGVPAPDILIAKGISGPCLVGWLRPAILLPPEGEDAEREILIHELAHLARGDCVWQLMSRLAVALVWFQPLMWLLDRQMEQMAEEACDDVVLAQGGHRGTYARTLADLAEKSQRRFDLAGAGVGVVGMRSAVGRRVARLLDATHSISTRLDWPARSGIALAAALLAAGVGMLRPSARALADAGQPKNAAVGVRHVGRVVDEDGKPVAGAEILLVQKKIFEMPVLESTRTDAHGAFSVSYGARSSIENWIEIQAFAPGKGLGLAIYDPANIGEIRLKPATRITLTITGSDGRPLSGFRVYPTSFVSRAPIRLSDGRERESTWFIQLPPVLSERMAGMTAADGTVTLRDLPRGSKFELGFDDDRFAYLDPGNRIALSASDPVSPPANIHLEPGATISGAVRYGPTGQPAAGIQVFAQSTNRTYSGGSRGALTNDKGQFRIAHLNAGEYNVMLALRDGTERDWTAAAHEWVKVAAGANLTNMDFSLIKGGIVTGKVTMADTGQPIADTEVGAHGPAHPRSSASVQGSKAGPDGTYTLRVPPGVQYVYVMGVVPPAYREDKQDIREVKVEDGQVVTLDFKVPRRAGVPVNGVVIGLDGKPAPGIAVRALINPRGLEAFAFATSDAKGRFHFDALPPSAPLSVRDGEWGTAEAVYFDQGQDVRLQLVQRVKLTLPGLITDEQGKPIAGARVKLNQRIAVMGVSSGDIVTGSDGRYQIANLYADSNYDIAADADGYGEAYARLALDANTGRLPTLKLPRADASVGGTVVDPTGKPVAGITVHLNNGMSPKTAVTDADGRFSFKIVPGSNHLIWIAVKEQGVVGPNANGRAGRSDIRLVLPKEEQ